MHKKNNIYSQSLKSSTHLNYQDPVTSSFDFDDDEDDISNDKKFNKKSSLDSFVSETNSQNSNSILNNFGVNITQKAYEGNLDPIVGREKEIERVVQILSRRKKNNPILIGNPGVGKSAIVEGLALRIVQKRVSHTLINKQVYSLDMPSVVAGTKYRGEFEERMQAIIEEARNNKNIILFIDEIHNIMGAGSTLGSMDAANILKPALASGELQCIGATTTNEFRKSIEKDGALERRFQKIIINPTTQEETLHILKNIKEKYEDHHLVKYTDQALEKAVSLSERYISDRFLPDKAIDIIDEAGSRVNINNFEVPDVVKNQEKLIESLVKEKSDAAIAQNYEHAANLRDRILNETERLESIKEEWLKKENSKREPIDVKDIEEVVSLISGIPVSKMSESDSIHFKEMKEKLNSVVINQEEAILKLVRAITRNKIGLKDPNKPIGTFFFLGSTGVGKTFLAKNLAEILFNSSKALIRFDMSEYMDKESTNKLIGAPPGYIGYDDGGLLTEKVRRQPYSIILFDEIEKAHPEVFNLLLQIMDEGHLTDNNGVTINFKNTIIIMTSNIGSRQVKDFGNGIGFRNNEEENTNTISAEIIKKALKKKFSPEFLNRLDDIITFKELDKKSIKQISKNEINKLINKMETMNYHLEVSDEVVDYLVNKGFQPQYGARPIIRAIQTYLEDELCNIMMDSEISKDTCIEAVLEKDKIKFHFKNKKLIKETKV